MTNMFGLTIIPCILPFEQSFMHNPYMLTEICSRSRAENSRQITNDDFEQGYTIFTLKLVSPTIVCLALPQSAVIFIDIYFHLRQNLKSNFCTA